MKCIICGNQVDGPYGHNPWPIKVNSGKDKCCTKCNVNVVIPARIDLYTKETSLKNKEDGKR